MSWFPSLRCSARYAGLQEPGYYHAATGKRRAAVSMQSEGQPKVHVSQAPWRTNLGAWISSEAIRVIAALLEAINSYAICLATTFQ